jgi:outer membrane immunogenic protein
MTKLLFGAAAAVALFVGAPALAADLPMKAPIMAPAPAFSWTGWYAGLNAGGAWGHTDLSTATVFSPTGYFATTSPPAINAVGAQSVNRSGFTGGGQVGYNWQSGMAVFGLEADFDYLGLKGSASGSALYPCCAPTGFTVSSSFSTNWLLTFRPRVGFTADHWLFYVTGGLAVAQVKANFNFTDTFAAATESAAISNTKAGWTAGVGAEYALMGPWSLKVEYLHVDLGSVSATSTNLAAFTPPIPFPTNVYTHSASVRSDIVRVGFNFRL